MKLPYTLAQALIITALIPAWLPTINGWAFYEPKALLCWICAVVLMGIPAWFEKFGPGIKYV